MKEKEGEKPGKSFLQKKRKIIEEGIAKDGELHPVQEAFIEHDASQCGYCTPGMVMSCAHLVENNSNPSLDDLYADFILRSDISLFQSYEDDEQHLLFLKYC